MEHAREVIREIADRIPVRPGDDGVPVAELSLNDQMPLGQVAGGSQIGLVAGACYELVQYSRFSPRKASAGPTCRQAAAATATNSLPTTLCALGRGTAAAAANAGPIVPRPGGAGAGRWLKWSSSSRMPTTAPAEA